MLHQPLARAQRHRPQQCPEEAKHGRGVECMRGDTGRVGNTHSLLTSLVWHAATGWHGRDGETQANDGDGSGGCRTFWATLPAVDVGGGADDDRPLLAGNATKLVTYRYSSYKMGMLRFPTS